MTLLEVVQQTQARIGHLGATEQSVIERETTKSRHDQLLVAMQPLKENCTRLAWLKAPIDKSSNEIARAVDSISRIEEMLATNAPISEVTKGQKWARMLNNVSAAAATIEIRAKDAWRAMVNNLGSFEEPITVSGNLAQTPNNVAALEIYRQRYASYREIARKGVPDSEAEIQQAARAAAAVEEAYRAFNFAVPAAVKQFLQAANSLGGARLGQLSDEVRGWLIEQGLEANYVIRSGSK